MGRTGMTAGLGRVLASLLGVTCTAGLMAPVQAAVAPYDDAPVRAATAAPAPAEQSRSRPRRAKPAVRRLSPGTGPATGGTEVVVQGRNLTGVRKVVFGSTRATHVRVQSSRKLVLEAPPHAAGEVPVRVQTKGGWSDGTKASTFRYVTPPPALAQVTPRAGPTTGGTTVTLTGSGLAGVKAVRFGNANASSVHVVSSTTVTVTTPGRVAGPVDVTVTTVGGSAALPDAFTYAAAPTLSSVSPDSGPITGATVTLTGTGLTADAVVRFDGAPATDIRAAVDGTTLTVTTPVHAAGWVDVTLTTIGGSAGLTNGYLFVGGTTLAGISPSVGPAAGGGTVTLTGTGFTAETLVVFGTKPSLDVSVNQAGTSLTAQLPSHTAGVVDVAVSTRGDSAALAGTFTFVDAPMLTAVSPPTGPLAGGVAVSLTGTGFRADMEVRFGNAPATGVTVNPAGTQLSALTPAHATGVVDVLVSTPGGTSMLANSYEYVVAPTLTTVGPVAGPVAGATTVSLTGTGFRAGMHVSLGGLAGTGVSVTSATHATVTAPAHAAGDVDVSVSTPGGTATAVNAYTYVVPPTLTATGPDAGPVAGGTTVSVTGTGFRPGLQVTFGGVAGTRVTVMSGTQLTVTSPAHPAGTVAVSVTTPGGAATMGSGFTYLAAPALSSVSPVAGPVAGGRAVTLSGTGFRAGMDVSFGGVPATGVSVSPGGTQLTALTPAHAVGAVAVSVTTPGGSDVLSDAFTYAVSPTLTDVTPAAGPVAGGNTVALTGTGFRDGMQVLFGTTSVTGVAVNPTGTELTVVAPPHAAGAVTVVVSTPGGSASQASSYAYVAAPTLGAVSPDAGPLTGGTTVTLVGSDFRPGMQLLFGTAAATAVTVSPDGTQLTALAPAHSAGSVDLSVATPGGSATLGNSYTYLAAPTLASVSPPEGPSAGGASVTLTGSGFRAGTQVQLGGAPAEIMSINPAGTQLTATTAAHVAGDVDVAVTTPGGSAALVAAFTYVAAPTLASVSPAGGPTSGGTTVSLTGSGFRSDIQVTFDGIPAVALSVISATQLTVTTPAHAAGDVPVLVSTVGGSATLVNGYMYVVAPTLTTASPDEGPVAGGTSVTLTGTDLSSTTAVTFDGVPATGLVVVSDTEVTVASPAHVAGAVDVALSTAGGSATEVAAFTYVAAPVLSALTPDRGPEAGGTAVTLTGTDLTGVTAVTFDGTPATDVVVVDGQAVTVVTPPHASGATDVVVTTIGGRDTLPGGFTYEA